MVVFSGTHILPSIKVQLTSYPESIKDKCELICAKLHVWFTSRSGPAHSHVSPRHSLKFKVPPPGLYRIRPLYPKEADLVNAEPLNRLSCWGNRTTTVSGCGTIRTISTRNTLCVEQFEHELLLITHRLPGPRVRCCSHSRSECG